MEREWGWGALGPFFLHATEKGKSRFSSFVSFSFHENQTVTLAAKTRNTT